MLFELSNSYTYRYLPGGSVEQLFFEDFTGNRQETNLVINLKKQAPTSWHQPINQMMGPGPHHG